MAQRMMFVPYVLATALITAGLVPAAAQAQTSDAASTEAVTVFSLTDPSGDRTPVATEGIDALEEEGLAEAASTGELAVVGGATLSTARAAASSVPEVEDVAILTPPMETEEFFVAGVTWDGDGALPADAAVFIRVMEDGQWLDWAQLEVEAGANDDAAAVGGTEPFVAGGAEAVQVQVTGDPATLPPNVRLSLMPANPAEEEEVHSEPTDEPSALPTDAPTADVAQDVSFFPDGSTSVLNAVARSSAETFPLDGTATAVQAVQAAMPAGAVTAAPAIAPAAVSQPTVISRGGWGADPDQMTWTPRRAPLKAAVVHHTAGSNNYTQAQVPSVVRGIYHYHAVTRAWGDIGYNFLVDKWGRVYEGRSGSLSAPSGQMTIGAHASGFNTGTLGISAIGDYTKVGVDQAVMDAMARVIGWHFARAGIDPTTRSGITAPGTAYTAKGANLPRIFGHRDVGQTTCPGNDIYGRLPALIRAVDAEVDRFGSLPRGSLDAATVSGSSVAVRGWALDLDTPTSALQVDVLVNGKSTRVTANTSRPDVAAVYPSAGKNHGFVATVPLTGDGGQVCVNATDARSGVVVSIGCRTVSAPAKPSKAPLGVLDTVTVGSGTVAVKGWAFDPDTSPQSIKVEITAGGKTTTVVANQPRSDVSRAYAAAGPNHGFVASVPISGGTQQVCARALDATSGTGLDLGCRTVAVNTVAPRGVVDAATAGNGGITVRGWAFDADTAPSPVQVRVTVDGKATTTTANGSRPDVGRAHAAAGDNHGFQVTIPAADGRREVCVAVLDPLTQAATNLGCRSVRVGAVTTRWQGGDRFDTAVAVSREAFDPGVPVAYVANGLTVVDALAGAAVAGGDDAPVLLTQKDTLPATARAELDRLNPAKIVVLGGAAAVSPAVENSLQSLAPRVERWSGNDRYATAATISGRAFPRAGVPVVYLANGTSSVDALAAAPVAGRDDVPVLLTEAGSLPAAVRAELDRLNPGKVVVLGGTNAVSDAVVQEVRSVVGTVERWDGANRYATAANIATRAFGAGADVLYVANGASSADALAAAPVAGATGGPVLLVESDTVPTAVANEVTRLKPEQVVVLGGPNAINAAVQAHLEVLGR